MDVSIKLENAELTLKDVNSAQASAAIHGFFNVVHKQSVIEEPARVKPNEPQKIKQPIVPSSSSDNVQPSVSKALPKIDDQRSLQTPIRELIPKEHWMTGIKTDDGGERYQTYYWCDCGSKGKHFVRIEDKTVICRDCGTELYLEDASPITQENGLPERDNFGNFFIAREVVES